MNVCIICEIGIFLAFLCNAFCEDCTYICKRKVNNCIIWYKYLGIVFKI